MSILLSWAILSLAVWLASVLLPGFRVNGAGGVILVAAIFGALNWLIGWLLFVVIGIGTLGLGFLLAFLTRWVVDALLLKLTDALTTRLTIQGFRWAFAGALIMAAVGTLGEYLVRSVGSST